MKQFLVTLKLPVMAEDDQQAWEYGNNLASRAPNQTARGCDEVEGAEAEIIVEDAQ